MHIKRFDTFKKWLNSMPTNYVNLDLVYFIV